MPQRILPVSPARRAGLLMVLAMGSFVVNDTCVKVIAGGLPLGELIAIRGFVASLMIGVLCARERVLDQLPRLANKVVFGRALLDLVSTFLFITAIRHMPIANLTAVTQTVPLMVALLSVLILGERLGRAVLSAIALGFVGVLLIVKPEPSTVTIYDGFAIGVVVLVGFRDIMTARIPVKVPTLIVALANAGFIAIGGAFYGLWEGFVVPSAEQAALLCLAATFLSVGYMLIVATLRHGNLSASAPFRYSVLLFAILSGIVVFDDYPDWVGLVGMAMIVAAGLISTERRRADKVLARPQPRAR
jgi:drug/metabolite transporter (DMT)-like permease